MDLKLALGAMLVAGLAVALPVSAEYYEGKPACPEGMACTMQAPADDGNATAGCATANCAADGAPADAGSNCMDGQQGNETCRDDVQYLGGPAQPPADDTKAQEQAAKGVPGLPTLVIVAGLLGVAVLLRRR